MKFFLTTALTVSLVAPCGLMSARPNVQAHSIQSRDTWRSVRTNNLFVVGNAAEEDLRQVSVWLEFFHSNFAQLLSRQVLDSSVPTTVIVFKNDASFVPFKPLYQGSPANVAGFFQPGQDMNYIALSLEHGGRSILSTAFHEYVHLHLRDNLPGAPLWLSEGLAEFYSSFVHSNNDALLGSALPFYVRLLGRQEMIPLATLFSIDHDSPHYNEQDKTGIFYAQSWALVHYLILGDGGRRQLQFKGFLNRISSGDETLKAVESAFGVSLEVLERQFKEYVSRGEFPSQRVRLGAGPTPFIAMQRTALSEGEANFYLGDLLLHIRREADAEDYFKRAISQDPGFAPTYASLGLLCVRQRRYAEARKYLQRAVVSPQSYLIHYLYAYALSRESISSDGGIAKYPPESVQIMREELRKAIKLSPEFADAYYLLAFINLVASDQLDEAVTLVKRAQKLAPSKLGYSLVLAQIYLRQRDLQLAREVLEPLARQTANASVRADAQELLDSFNTPDGGASRNRSDRNPGRVESSVMRDLEEPPSTGPGPVSGGSISGSAIRDGHTIDNSGPMPALDQLMESYVQALGGAKALNALTSRVAKGTLDVVGVSRGGTIEIYAKAPGKTLTVMQAHPFGLVRTGFNGAAGWAQTRAGQRVIKGGELVSLQQDSDFYNPILLMANYPKMKLLGKSKIGYREVHVLELQPTVGSILKLYLDSNTYLPVRANLVNELGPLETYLDDWREVDGVKIPFSITQIRPRISINITIKEIKHNVPVDDSLFEKPAR